MLRQSLALHAVPARRYLRRMRKPTAADIAFWQKRVAELERELDAATKLADVKVIAGELRRTKAALKKAREYVSPMSQNRGYESESGGS